MDDVPARPAPTRSCPATGPSTRGAVLPRRRPRRLRPRPPRLLPLPDGTEDWIVYHAKTTSATTYTNRTTRAQKITWNADGSPDLGRPLATGATQDLPSGDPGAGTYWINDDGRSSGDGSATFTGTWNSGTGCATQCFWGDDHWSDQAGQRRHLLLHRHVALDGERRASSFRASARSASGGGPMNVTPAAAQASARAASSARKP